MSSAKLESEISKLGQRIANVTGLLHEAGTVDPLVNAQDISNSTSNEVTDIRETLIRLLDDMLQKVQGPTRTLIQMTNTARVRLMVMRTIVHFDLVTKVPEEGSVPLAMLASVVGVDQPLLDRVLQFAFTQGIFREATPGSGDVSHTELSRAIPLLAPWLKLVLSPVTILPDLYLPGALESSRDAANSKTAIELAFNKPFYEFIKSDSHLKLFQDGLKSLSMAQKACWCPYGGGHFRWEEQPRSLIIDIGGGNGNTAVEAATRNPDLHFIVQDLEENRVQAEQTIPKELQKRVLFQSHDFFTVQRRMFQQPVTFFMKWILHNWPDDRCVEILTHLLPLLVLPGSRLLVQEYVLSDCPHVRAMDMTMLPFFNSGARERTLQEFVTLFQQVDGRMKIAKVWEADEWGMKILEVTVV
jgi:6-hydroxytryprostatin B O-methyltransferase